MMVYARSALGTLALLSVMAVTASVQAEELPASALRGTIDLNYFEAPADARIWQPVNAVSGESFWTGGVETTFLAPIMSGITTRALIVSTSGTPEGVEVIDEVGLEMMTFAPRVWVGYNLGDGWGVVGRFWYLSDTQTAQDSFDLTAGDVAFEGQNRLQQYTVDLELTRDFEWGNWLMQGTCGVRFASIDYNAQLSQAGEFTSSLVAAGAESDRAFQGTGITFSLNGRRAWWENSAMHWIWNARGSAVFGRARYQANAGTEVLDTLGWEVDGVSETATFYDTLFIGEIQAGVQWEHRLQTTPATAFFRVVAEYQYWGGVNNEDLGVGLLNSSATADVGAQASARGINLDLIGLSLGAGLTW